MFTSKRNALRFRCALAAAVGGLMLESHAWATITASWLNPASGSWNDPTQWTTNPAYPNNGQPSPASIYDAVINASNGIGYTVTVPTNITIESLSLNSPDATVFVPLNETLRLANGSMSVSAGTFDLQGTLNSDGGVTIASNLLWENGTLSGNGSVNVLASGLVTIASGGQRIISTTLNNAGLINVSVGSPQLNGGTLNNLASGVINFSQLAPISSVGTNNLLNNSGQINILNAQTFSSIAIQNSGTINVLSSGLLTYGLGTCTYTTGTECLTGGTINLGSSATHLLDGTLTLAAQDVALNGATITGGGNLQIAGRFDWNGGTIGGSGTATVLPGAQLNIQSGTVGSLSRTLNNAGTINISTGSIFFNNGIR